MLRREDIELVWAVDELPLTRSLLELAVRLSLLWDSLLLCDDPA